MSSQAERRQRTRTAILDAAARVLVEHGEQGFSTSAVSGESGFSNGALFRHFPTRKDLVVAAVEHVLAEVRVGYRAQVAALGGDDVSSTQGIEAIIDFIWNAASDVRLVAMLEFYAQARTDPDLRRRLEPVVNHHNRESAAITDQFTAGEDGAAGAMTREYIALALVAMRGIVVNNLVGANVGAEKKVRALLSAAHAHALADVDLR